jgi:hypothetical protein
LSAGQRDGGKLDAQAETRRGEWAGVSHRAEAEAQLSHDRQQLHSASPYLAREASTARGATLSRSRLKLFPYERTGAAATIFSSMTKQPVRHIG